MSESTPQTQQVTEALLSKAHSLPDNTLDQVDAIFQDLVQRSPLTCRVYNKIWAGKKIWSHLGEKNNKDYFRRARHLSRLETTITHAGEVREGKYPDSTVYLAAFTQGEPPAVDFLAVVANNQEFETRLSIATIYPVKRERDLALFRKERLIWP